jgi:hypothetical protein
MSYENRFVPSGSIIMEKAIEMLRAAKMISPFS